MLFDMYNLKSSNSFRVDKMCDFNWLVVKVRLIHKSSQLVSEGSWVHIVFPQDSMRYLIQDSLVHFTQMVLDASHSTLKLPEDFTWGKDLINSTYKYVNAPTKWCP